ncbi:MAG: 1,2-phenylacetyl-CoA epoxidase subunit PaaD [Casimicrobiaceae bacterium]
MGAIWSALAGVADPEIPVVSVVDLGIVRRVGWDAEAAGRLAVQVTPTYSGCPATDLINAEIRTALAAIGVADVHIDVVLSPPWTTAWLTPTGQRQLLAYGITPPGAARPVPHARVDVAGISPLRRAGFAVSCPRCGSEDTALVAQFGSTACKAQYRCRACLEPFDFFKPI